MSENVLNLLELDLAEVLDSTRPHWEAMRGQRLLLTGGTGFIGKWLLGTFLHANRELGLQARVSVLSRNVESFLAQFPELRNAAEIDWIEGDVRSFELADGQEHAYVIHAATDVVASQPASEIFDTCVTGTKQVLKQTRRAGSRRLLLLSSGAVYGRAPAGLERFLETWTGGPEVLGPGAAYGEGKRASELICALESAEQGLEVSIARCFAFVGPHLPLDKHFAIGNFIRDAIDGRAIHIQGDGTPLRSYLYAADLATWLWTLLFTGANARAYNVGGDESLSIAGLAHRVVKALDASSQVSVAKAAAPGAVPQAYVPDVSRAGNELGLRPQVGLDEAIQRTARWATQYL